MDLKSLTNMGERDYYNLLDEVLPKLAWYSRESFEIVRDTLVCKDKRQNGTCGCVQRFITSQNEMRGDFSALPKEFFNSSEKKLTHIANLSFESHRLKTERNPIAGRRYSDSFANHVNEHRSDLSRYKLCKKAIAAVLHCSLNFLYRDNNNKQKVVKRIEQICVTPCCEKQCLQKLCKKYPSHVGQWRRRLEARDAKSEENRKVFFELRDHVLTPCMRAVGEITGLSKATLNNLSSKTPESGIKHALQGRRRQQSGGSRPSIRSSASSVTSLTSVSSISPSTIEPKPYIPQMQMPLPPETNPAHRDTVIRELTVKIEPEEPALPVIRSEEISRHVGPMRSRLNAINEDEKSAQERIATEPDIPPILATYDSVIIDARQSSVHDLPSGISPTIRSNPSTPPVEVERRKRKKMPGLLPLNSPTAEHENSPPLRMPIDFPPGSPEKKRTPAPFSRGTVSFLNTPTITPNTPSNPTQAKNTPVDQRRVFNFNNF